MQPRFETIPEKKLIGKHLAMSYTGNRTAELWRSFMPRRKEIANRLNSDLISLQVYPLAFGFSRLDPNITFEKWAVVEVSDFDSVPVEMETLVLPAGLYAVFTHKGPASAGAKIFQIIFGTWLPASGYELDNRPHFELLGEKYKNEDPESEEELWVPVRKIEG